MELQNIYVNDQYWEANATFHEGDAEFKAAECFKLLHDSGVLGSIKSGVDIGCGSGKFLAELSPKITGAKFIGMDVSPTPIDRANDLHASDRVKFCVGDATQIDKTYDIAFLNDVFEHVEDYIGFLRAIRPAAKMFYFNVPLDMHVSSVFRHSYMKTRKDLGHLHYFSERSAVATLEYAGYSIIAKKHNQHVLHSLKTYPSLRKYVAAIPRLASYKLAPSWSVHVLGGASLGVLCRPGN